ncbi:hypothetical protein B0H16DRAFT_1895290 [Mycena metata]|uniref:Uncharacterized protein n=1 Tax=Mycena metata TaxID=1033252 RepID=A0AAD7MN84_9AGAR|nr:hypothetical protein B0H16DRAFT_1895290 [Mycena metata]
MGSNTSLLSTTTSFSNVSTFFAHLAPVAADIDPFISHYERLLAKNNVQDPIAQCEEILQYCTPRVRSFVRGCQSFHDHDWDALKGELLKWYGPEPPIPRLVAYRHAHATRAPIGTIAQWKRYYRSYCAAVGELHNTQQLSTFDYLYFFWAGIPRELQDALEMQLERLRPMHDPMQPWTMDDVCSVARKYLTSNRRYADIVPEGPSVYDLDHTGAEPDSEDDAASEDSESESS